MSLILHGICCEVLLNHESYLEYDSVVKFTQVKSCELFNLFNSVYKSISMYEKLSRRFGNVEVVLEEFLYCEECFVVEVVDGAFFENLVKEASQRVVGS